MFVAASTSCFKNLNLAEAIEKIVDLEFTCIELCMDETTGHFSPTLAVENFGGGKLWRWKTLAVKNFGGDNFGGGSGFGG